jgi:hypothetical protein
MLSTLLTIEATAVLPEGRITYADVGLWSDETETAIAHTAAPGNAPVSATEVRYPEQVFKPRNKPVTTPTITVPTAPTSTSTTAVTPTRTQLMTVQGWVFGETLDHALTALEQSLARKSE